MADQPARRFPRGTILVAGLILSIAGLGAAKATGILFPDWSKPTKGTYTEPAGEVGKKAAADGN